MPTKTAKLNGRDGKKTTAIMLVDSMPGVPEEEPLEERLLSDLRPNPDNPRLIQPEKKVLLALNLQNFGDLGSIIENKTTGNMIGGHQRVAAFTADPNAKIIITERLDRPDTTGTLAFGYVETNGTRYSFREVAWSLQRERSAMIAANANGGMWDDSKLQNLLRGMDTAETQGLGFTEDELKRLLPSPGEAPDEFPVHDENIPVQHKCPKCSYTWSGKPS